MFVRVICIMEIAQIGFSLQWEVLYSRKGLKTNAFVPMLIGCQNLFFSGLLLAVPEWFRIFFRPLSDNLR